MGLELYVYTLNKSVKKKKQEKPNWDVMTPVQNAALGKIKAECSESDRWMSKKTAIHVWRRQCVRITVYRWISGRKWGWGKCSRVVKAEIIWFPVQFYLF